MPDKPVRPPKIEDQVVKHTYKTDIKSSPIELLSTEERAAMLLTMKVDLNTAGEAEMQNIPGVGPKMAEAIVAYRDANGPFKSFADVDNIPGTGPKFMESLPEHAQISGGGNSGAVPGASDLEHPDNGAGHSGAAAPAGSNHPAPGAAGPGAINIVNINKASAAELGKLPGVGASMAAAILQYRQDHGPFKSVDELDKVSGIGPAKLEKIRPAASVR